MSGREIKRFGLSQGDIGRRGFLEGVAQVAKIAAMANRHIASNPRFFEALSDVLTPPVQTSAIAEPVVALPTTDSLAERLVLAHRARVDFQEVLGTPRFYSAFMNQVPRVVGMLADYGIAPEGVVEGLTQAKEALPIPGLQDLMQAQIAQIHILTGNISEGLAAAPSSPGVIHVGHLRTAIDRCIKTGEDPTSFIEQAIDKILNTPLTQDNGHRFVELELLTYHVQNPEDAIRILRLAEGLLEGAEGRDLTGSYQRLATAYARWGQFDKTLSFLNKMNVDVREEDKRFSGMASDLVLDDIKSSIIYHKKFDEALQLSDKPEFRAWVLAQKALYLAQQGISPAESIDEAMELTNKFTGNIAEWNKIKTHLVVARALATNLEGAVSEELVISSWNTLTANDRRFSPHLALDIIRAAEAIGMDAENYYDYYFDFVEKQKPEPKDQTERGDDMLFLTGYLSYSREGIQSLLVNGHLDRARELLQAFPVLEDHDFDLVLRAELAKAEAKQGLSADELERLSGADLESLRKSADPAIKEALEYFRK